MRGVVKAGAAIATLVMLTGTSGYYVNATRNKFLPMAKPVTPGEEITIKRGEVFMTTAIGQSWRATLDGDVTMTIADKSATVARGTPMQVMRVAGGAADQLGGRQLAFCSDPQVDVGKAWANLFTLGLAATGRRTGSSTQFCLVDADADGMVERAFLVGAKRSEDLVPIAITPTPIKVERDAPMPDSEARLRFAGVAGIFGNIGFDLEVVENGRPLTFSNGRTLINKAKFPKDVTIFGASFTVLSYDPDTNEARLRMNSGFGSGEYGITTTTTYIPIYVR